MEKFAADIPKLLEGTRNMSEQEVKSSLLALRKLFLVHVFAVAHEDRTPLNTSILEVIRSQSILLLSRYLNLREELSH